MDTASPHFIAFGLAVALLSNLRPSSVWRSSVLFVASIAFVWMLAQGAMLLLPLTAFLLLGYFAVATLTSSRVALLPIAVITIILVYAWLKKYTFLPSAVLLHHPYFTLGLSYIFFRVLHLTIESGEGTEKRPISLGAYLLYMLNFTTLVAGPIQRYDAFARDQFAAEPIALGPRVIGLQIERIVRGFVKVNVVAMLLNMVRLGALAQMAQPGPESLKFVAACKLSIVYPLFLYCNFSGYIDIVIALARLMRVRLPENFDRPFSATSFIDFWTRWHITLSTWLKTYVYSPLMIVLMRRITSSALEPWLAVFSFFVTFFLIGIWHGRTSEFVFYGLLLGGGVSINKLWQLSFTRALGRKSYKALAKGVAYTALSRGLTFSWFALSLFWLWASWAQINSIFTALRPVQWVGVWLVVWLFATIVLAIWEWLRTLLLSMTTSEGPVLASRYARTVYASVLGVAAIVMMVLLNQPAPEIVYKAF